MLCVRWESLSYHSLNISISNTSFIKPATLGTSVSNPATVGPHALTPFSLNVVLMCILKLHTPSNNPLEFIFHSGLPKSNNNCPDPKGYDICRSSRRIPAHCSHFDLFETRAIHRLLKCTVTPTNRFESV